MMALAAALGVCVAGCSDDSKIVPTITDLRSPSPDLRSADLSAAPQDLSGVSPAAVVINEVFPHGTNELTDPDWAELKNNGTTPMDLSGYRVRDDKTTMTLPAGTTVAPGQYLVMYCDDTPDGGAAGVIHLPFKFGGSDEFWLLSPDGTTVDSVTWKSNNVPAGKSYGRLPDGTGQFAAQTPTRGTANGF
jgi:hypothetical protein